MTGDVPSRRVLVLYGLPALAVALPTIPIYLHLPALYGAELGLGLAMTGAVLLIARLFDTLTDPVVGVLSDRLRLRGVGWKPWIACGAVICGIGLLRLLDPPAEVGPQYLLGYSLLLYAGWTMIAVPYLAWGAALSTEYDVRTRIVAWREAFGLVGIVGAGAVFAVATGFDWTEREATAAIAWFAIATGSITFPLLLWCVPDITARGPRSGMAPEAQGLRAAFLSLAKNRPFLRLLAAWFVNGLANGIPAALFFLYLEFRLGADDEERAAFVVVYFVAAIVAIPLWTTLSSRYGKHRVWCGAMAAACVAFACVPLIGEGGFTAFAAVCVVTGMALGADLALPPAIQADVVDYGTLRSGRAQPGLLFSLWGMGTKLSLAAAVGVALPGVDALGFDPDAPTERGVLWLVLIYAALPVAIKIGAIAMMWRFPLTAERHAVIRQRLTRRSA